MSGKHQSKLLAFEIAALRRMLRVSRRDRIRNVNIYARLGVTETLVQRVYKRQHTWLGHVLWMSNEGIVKVPLEGRVDGKRRVGNPKTTWLPTALERCGLRLGEAIAIAQNRLDWRRLRHHAGAYVPPRTRHWWWWWTSILNSIFHIILFYWFYKNNKIIY